MTLSRLRLLALFVPIVGTLSLRAGDPAAPPVSDLAKTPVDGKGVEKAVAPPQEPPIWRFSAGYQWRQLGSLNWQTGSIAARTQLPWLVGHPSRSGSPGSGSIPTAGIGNHTYSDGFVNEDGGTPFDGSTWNWGYNNASQLQGSDLLFHASATGPGSSVTTAGSSSVLRSSGWSDDLSGSGWFASLESPVLFKAGCVSISFEAGYSYAMDGSSHATPGVFTAEQHSSTTTTSPTTTNITDSFDVSGLAVVPSAPYAGTFTGPGAIINNAPTSRMITNSGGGSSTSSLTALFRSNVAEDFNLRLHTISLGPNLSGEWQRLRFGFGVGLGLNVADWNAGYEETLYVRQNGGASRVLNTFHASASATDLLPGLYLETSAQFSLNKWLALFVAGRYDWAGSLSEPVGPSHANFDLGGWTVMGGVTISF